MDKLELIDYYQRILCDDSEEEEKTLDRSDYEQKLHHIMNELINEKILQIENP